MTDKQKSFIAEVHNDGTKVRITMGREEMELTPEELDTVIQELGVRRAMMTPAIPHNLEPNPRMVPTTAPIFAAGVHDPQNKVIVTALRHPGYGWLAFLHNVDQAKNMCGAIGHCIKTVEPIQMPKPKIILPGG